MFYFLNQNVCNSKNDRDFRTHLTHEKRDQHQNTIVKTLI